MVISGMVYGIVLTTLGAFNRDARLTPAQPCPAMPSKDLLHFSCLRLQLLLRGLQRAKHWCHCTRLGNHYCKCKRQLYFQKSTNNKYPIALVITYNVSNIYFKKVYKKAFKVI
jgi:hypothetical protein